MWLSVCRRCQRLLRRRRPLPVAQCRRDQFSKSLLECRTGHPDRGPIVYFYGHYAPTFQNRRRPSCCDGPTVWTRSRRIGNLRCPGRCTACGDDRYRWGNGHCHGIDFTSGHVAKQVFQTIGNRHNMRLGHARPDNSPLYCPDYPC